MWHFFHLRIVCLKVFIQNRTLPDTIFKVKWFLNESSAQQPESKAFQPSNHQTFQPDYTMESIRQKQIGELIRRYFSMILSEEGINIYGRDKLVTLTGVKMTPDLLVAKLYISVYGTEHKQEVILELEDNHARLRQALASKVGKQMRRVPEIELYLDDTVDEMYRVDNLLNRVGDEDKNIGK